MNNLPSIAIAIKRKEDESGWKYKIVSGNNEDIIGAIKEIGILEEDKKIDDTFKLHLVWHTAIRTGIEGANIYKEHFAQNLLIEKNKYPIIHFLDSSAEKDTKEIIEYLYSDGDLRTEGQVSPRFFSILDSSIWNYFVPLKDYINEDKNIHYSSIQAFRNALNNITDNYLRKVYYLEVASEYADLNARLTGESYLNGAHEKHVSPIIFHSESAINLLIEKEFLIKNGNDGISTSCIEQIKSHAWRFLLVDDKSKETLKGISTKDGTTKEGVTKMSIIISLFNQLFKDKTIIQRKYNEISEKEANNTVDKNVILIEFAETINEAKEALRTKEYDAILLDYLLDKDDNVEYGYHLLEDIYNVKTSEDIIKNNEDKKIEEILNDTDNKNTSEYGELVKYINNRHLKGKKISELKNQLKEDSYKNGPHRKLYFMFISAYTTAVHERLLAEGLNRSEKYWYIGEGACPTNTPVLFKYRLLHLMLKRLNQTGISLLSEEKIINTVNKIYHLSRQEEQNEKSEKIKAIRQRANERYQDILGFHYDYSILNDEDKGHSYLVNSFLIDKVHYGAMLEHLLQLVHLTAFGTVRQWPEIWEEYTFFARTVNRSNRDSTIKTLLNNLEEDIEKYIIDLKSNE